VSDQTDECFGEPIYTYTDQQALDDGVLVAIAGEGGVNRVTRAVFDHFVKPIGDPAFQVFNLTPLMEAIRVMLKIELKEGWRTATYQGKELWLVPNEVVGFTLMFPEDY
jgi:hypothetical protein